jgi:hypothetical protein
VADSKFTFTGLKELQENLRAVQRHTREAMTLAAVKHANRVMVASKALVPVESGALMISGEVLEPVVTDSGVTVDLVYGTSEPTSNYAVVQHERLDYNHPNGGQAKYLEQPLLAMADDLTRELAETVKL